MHAVPPPVDERSRDEALVRDLRRGDDRAAAALYDRCHEAVERSILRVVRSRDVDFEDLVQLAFERVLRSLHKGKFDAGDFTLPRWASSVATHVAIDALRSHAVRRRHLVSGSAIESLPTGNVSEERQLEARSEIERLERVLAKMKASHAEALLLHDVYGHDLEEMALVLGVSVAAAQSRLVRGRKELLRRLGASSGKEPS